MMVKLKINGMEAEAKPGETIMQAAARNGIDIPHFCHNERLPPIGACRLCVVELKGVQRLAASCSWLSCSASHGSSCTGCE